MVEYAYNPSMWGIGAGRSQVWIEHGLHSKTVREGNGRMGIEKEGNMEGKKKKKERSQYWCSRSPRELSLKSEPISPRTKRLGIPFAPVTKPISIWPPPSPVYSPWSSPLSIAVLLPEMSIFETRARGGVNKHISLGTMTENYTDGDHLQRRLLACFWKVISRTQT